MIANNFYLKTRSLTFLSCNIISICLNAADNTKPNILICVADDATYLHMSAYGCKWVSTPGFDRVAREGLLFTNAYTPNAKSAPSRACLLTGRNSWQLKEAANHVCYFPTEFKTYPEILGQSNYYVGHTQKGWEPGVANDAQGKPRELTGKAFNKHKLIPPTTGISDNDYTSNFIDFLDSRPNKRPFCFWYGSIEPHRGYEFQSGIKKGGKKLSDIDSIFSFWPGNDTVKADLLDYAYELEYFDSHVKRMLDVLEKRGELDNTIVIVLSDNGMPFPRVKGQEYEYSNHLPMAIMWKNGIKKPGRVIDDFVSFIDIAPTFLELAGVDIKTCEMAKIEGRSLTDLFYSDKSGWITPQKRDHVLIGKERHDVGRPHDWGYPIRGIVKNDFLFLINFEISRWPSGNPETGYLTTDASPTKTQCIKARNNSSTYKYWQWNFGKRPAEELYNIKKDPSCIVNLATNKEYEALIDSLRQQLIKELKEQGDPRMFGQGHIFDEYPYAHPDVRNFYERYMKGEKVQAGWVIPSDFDKVVE